MVYLFVDVLLPLSQHVSAYFSQDTFLYFDNSVFYSQHVDPLCFYRPYEDYNILLSSNLVGLAGIAPASIAYKTTALLLSYRPYG